MNSFYSKNTALFSQRFPALAGQYVGQAAQFLPQIPELTLIQAKNGLATALYKGLHLHSAYDPQREAQKLIETSGCEQTDAAVFMGCGLGYGPIAFAARCPQKTLVIIEPDIAWLLTAFTCLDWSAIFTHKNLVLLAGANHQTVIALLEKIGLSNCSFLHNKAQTAHNEKYFTALEELIERNRQKKEINDATLQKFGSLWLRNTLRNASHAAALDGIARYRNRGKNLKACILAAGPSLDAVLPHLPQLKKRCIIICVDTALKACLKAGCEPHFIVIGDPQYWNFRHLDSLSAPHSILVTELAVWPSVFGFNCREIILFSSLYSPGKFIEEFTGNPGELGAGGSVATTAWDFARHLGCETIFAAGLDLGFPANKTHFKGSTFEERVHLFSNRFTTAENSSFNALYGALPFYGKDYGGKPILTDKRLSLYAWWFESKCAEFPRQKTLAFAAHGLRIPGVKPAHVSKALELPECRTELEAACFDGFDSKSSKAAEKKQKLEQALRLAAKQFRLIQTEIEKALVLCTQGIALEKKDIQSDKDLQRKQQIVQNLNEIGKKITQDNSCRIARLLFSSENQPQKLFIDENSAEIFENAIRIYRQISKAVLRHLKYL